MQFTSDIFKYFFIIGNISLNFSNQAERVVMYITVDKVAVGLGLTNLFGYAQKLLPTASLRTLFE
jgi:hypothetical protein